jgi:D-serine deaminase-like pyridoxal phosphate-dependent protein
MRSLHYPHLLLNEEKVRKNINRMANKASSLGLKFRPHFKTHQSLEIGNWFKDHPIDGITVSSLKMAEYFASDGWSSITIAFPVNILELKEIDQLASKIDLRVLSVDVETIQILDKGLSNKVGIYIEIDPGYGRSGVHIDNKNAFEDMISTLNRSVNLKFKGFYSHAGHTYRSRSKDQILETSISIVKQLDKLKESFNYPICFGDTPSCSVLEDFGSIDEISPGNFVFYDWIQTKIGSCSYRDIAVAMRCAVVAKYPQRNELLIHGGAVHFSKDLDTLPNSEHYFGQVVKTENHGWSDPVEGSYLKSISQEHGIVHCTEQLFKDLQIGDLITIFPIHSCLTADLMGRYITTSGSPITHLSEKKI